MPPSIVETVRQAAASGGAVRAQEAGPIVAIGGGSTKGAAAGSPDLAYPHRLQVALPKRFPGCADHGRQSRGCRASRRARWCERFPTDVFAEKPVLVVWETGISDAVRGIDIDDFAAALQTGIDEVKNRAIDIVLVDMQFSRRTSTVIDFEHYLTRSTGSAS